MNTKLQKLLAAKNKSIYGLHKLLNVTPQAAAYIVKESNLKSDFERLNIIKDYLEVDNIEDFLD